MHVMATPPPKHMVKKPSSSSPVFSNGISGILPILGPANKLLSTPVNRNISDDDNVSPEVNNSLSGRPRPLLFSQRLPAVQVVSIDLQCAMFSHKIPAAPSTSDTTVETLLDEPLLHRHHQSPAQNSLIGDNARGLPHKSNITERGHDEIREISGLFDVDDKPLT